MTEAEWRTPCIRAAIKNGLRDRLAHEPGLLSRAQPSRHDAQPPVEQTDAHAVETLTSMIGG